MFIVLFNIHLKPIGKWLINFLTTFYSIENPTSKLDL